MDMVVQTVSDESTSIFDRVKQIIFFSMNLGVTGIAPWHRRAAKTSELCQRPKLAKQSLNEKLSRRKRSQKGATLRGEIFESPKFGQLLHAATVDGVNNLQKEQASSPSPQQNTQLASRPPDFRSQPPSQQPQSATAANPSSPFGSFPGMENPAVSVLAGLGGPSTQGGILTGLLPGRSDMVQSPLAAAMTLPHQQTHITASLLRAEHAQ